MLRNDTNGRIWLCESVRMWDAAESLLEVSEYRHPSHETRWNVWSSSETNDARHFLEFCLVDFKEAFFTLDILQEELAFVVVRGLTRWVVFLCVAFWLDV